MFACFRQFLHWVSVSVLSCEDEVSCERSDVAPAALLVFPQSGHQPAGRAGWSADPPQQTPPPPARYLHCRLLPHHPRPPGVSRGSGRDAGREVGPARREQVPGHSAQPPPENALEQHRGKKVCIMSRPGSISTLPARPHRWEDSHSYSHSPGSWSRQELLPNRLLVDCCSLSHSHHLSQSEVQPL